MFLLQILLCCNHALNVLDVKCFTASPPHVARIVLVVVVCEKCSSRLEFLSAQVVGIYVEKARLALMIN
jgi:hypothetical protein